MRQRGSFQWATGVHSNIGYDLPRDKEFDGLATLQKRRHRNASARSVVNGCQRIIEHDIRLREGEVNLLGGLIQSTMNAIVTGVPGLGEVPLIKYLFSDQHREVNDQEVLVMLTPSIIRLPEPALANGSGHPVEGGGGTGPAGPPEPFRPGELRPEAPAQPQ